MRREFLLAGVVAAIALPLHAKDTSYIGSVHVVPGDGADTARGTVFVDTNRNSAFDAGEVGLEGVAVSNGREVVLTDATGAYALPAYDDMNLFVTKPAGYAVPVNDQMVPQFNYIHKAAGSPPLRFGGIDPTGPLPAEVNFPLIEDPVGDSFECLAFGDTQPYSNREIGYVRDTVGRMLLDRDLSDTECLIFMGDVMGDDLSLYDRFKDIVAKGGVPQYFVAGNHDLDFDAESDQHSFDTFRTEWGPEYYSFQIGDVHFVTLDNVRYPCNGVDPHPFCSPDRSTTYNGVISDRQLDWLRADLEHVGPDKLVVLNAHIPFQTFTDNRAAKHQTDNLAELAEIVAGRPVLGLAGHTHTTENHEVGVSYEGWEENTGLAAAPFHQIVTGAVSGSWWAGDRNPATGVPHSTQRLGAPRGFYSFDFKGPIYIERYETFDRDADDQLHASFNTPRFRDWAEKLIAYADLYGVSDVMPPVTANDLGDLYMITQDDLADGTWVAVNLWNGSKSARVSLSINGGAALSGDLTQPGDGEAKRRGVEFADPLALVAQSTQSDMAVRSAEGGDDTAGYQTWQGTEWTGAPGPFQRWMLTDNSAHLWRVDLPQTMPLGVHVMEITATDRHGQTFTESYSFEVVDDLPNPNWETAFWE